MSSNFPELDFPRQRTNISAGIFTDDGDFCDDGPKRACPPKHKKLACTSTCINWGFLIWAMMIFKCLVILATLGGIVWSLIWLSNIRSDVQHLNTCTICEELGQKFSSQFLEKYDAYEAQHYFYKDVKVCYNGTTYDDLYAFHYDLHHWLYDHSIHDIHHLSTYGSCGCEPDTCIITWKYACDGGEKEEPKHSDYADYYDNNHTQNEDTCENTCYKHAYVHIGLEDPHHDDHMKIKHAHMS